MRGIAILGIMLHNYCHYVKGIVKENEYQFVDGRCDRLWEVLTNPDEFLPMHLLSFFGCVDISSWNALYCSDLPAACRIFLTDCSETWMSSYCASNSVKCAKLLPL